jgi:hypothetical protein
MATVSRPQLHAHPQPRAWRRLIPALLLFVPVPNGAIAGPVRGPCQGSQCQEFELLDRRTIRAGPNGTLIWVRTLAWTSDGPHRRGQIDETGHVFCSTTRPALIVTERGLTSAVMLAPLSPWEYEQRPGLYARYFEACHNLGTEVATGRQALARDLGYRVLRVNVSRPLGLSKPEGIFYFPSATRPNRP